MVSASDVDRDSSHIQDLESVGLPLCGKSMSCWQRHSRRPVGSSNICTTGWRLCFLEEAIRGTRLVQLTSSMDGPSRSMSDPSDLELGLLSPALLRVVIGDRHLHLRWAGHVREDTLALFLATPHGLNCRVASNLGPSRSNCQTDASPRRRARPQRFSDSDADRVFLAEKDLARIGMHSFICKILHY